MSSSVNQPLMEGLSPRQNTFPDAQFSNYVRKQSFNGFESLDAGVTIKTKEGDLVTLTSNTHAEINAFMYDSKGVLQTDSGSVAITQNMREITLISGESFTFSVVGDLSQEELEDIETIVKGIDEIISQMVTGDMDGAVAKAVSMGGYDSISMYAADITYQKSYAMTSNTIDQFSEKMIKSLEKFEEKLVDKAQNPIDQLFRHHLEAAKKNKGKEISIYNTIENVRKQMEKLNRFTLRVA